MESLEVEKYPFCIAKTQYSISEDIKKLGYPFKNTINVQDIIVSNGAGFIVVYLGNIFKNAWIIKKKPAYKNMEISSNGIITGLY